VACGGAQLRLCSVRNAEADAWSQLKTWQPLKVLSHITIRSTLMPLIRRMNIMVFEVKEGKSKKPEAGINTLKTLKSWRYF
jgi:hypothetical protein